MGVPPPHLAEAVPSLAVCRRLPSSPFVSCRVPGIPGDSSRTGDDRCWQLSVHRQWWPRSGSRLSDCRRVVRQPTPPHAPLFWTAPSLVHTPLPSLSHSYRRFLSFEKNQREIAVANCEFYLKECKCTHTRDQSRHYYGIIAGRGS